MIVLYFRYAQEIYPHMIKIVYALMGMARTGSVCATMAITLERYFVIVQPLATFTCKKILGPFAMAFAIVWNIPRFFEWKLQVSAFPYNFTHYENITTIHESEFRKSYSYKVVYRVWLNFIVIEAIPYITIIVLNAMILNKILKSYLFRRSFLSYRSRTISQDDEHEVYQLALIPSDDAIQRQTEPTNEGRALYNSIMLYLN